MGARSLFHEVLLDAEEAVNLGRVERSHGYLIATRDDRYQIRIGVCDNIFKNVVMLLVCHSIGVSRTFLRNIHTADIIERVCQLHRCIIVRCINTVLAGSEGQILTSDLLVAALKAMATEEAAGLYDAGNVSLDLDLAHFFRSQYVEATYF